MRQWAVISHAALMLAATACQCTEPLLKSTIDAGQFADGGATGTGGGGQPGTSIDAGIDAGNPFTLDGGVAVSFGDDVLPMVRARLEAHVRAVEPGLLVLEANDDPLLVNGARHYCFGHTAPAHRLSADADAKGLGAVEGFIVRVEATPTGSRAVALGASGDARATAYASYALLEALGFAFLHPLKPTRPSSLRPLSATLTLREVPRWPERTIHLHTQHPLELTNLLQGWGDGGPDDFAGFTAGLTEWDTYLEWLLANRQNGVEWFLLWADSWKTFADSADRQARLKTLVDHVHSAGLRAGLDVPIVFGQQHSFRLLRTQRANDEAAELAEIRSRVDWVLTAGVDFLGTESGTSEFTAPAAQRMLDWMNAVANQAGKQHVPVFIKVHASTGQTVKDFTDPQTGKDLNFNFLPHYATPELGVLPHTLQAYGLTDPAPIYGNQNFSEIERFMGFELGRRPMLFYPETAYWVSTDIDVPLFLPIYAQRRLADLRRLGSREDLGVLSAHLDGQLIFSSGWEWAYWLNDVVAARAAWNPSLKLGDDAAFQKALEPFLQLLEGAGPDVGQWVADFAKAEERLLIFGELGGVKPSSIAQRNGLGYLAAWDTWDDMSKLTGLLPPTQADRLGLVDLRNPLHSGADYKKEVAPLLAEMVTTFDALVARLPALRAKLPGANAGATELFEELADAAQMTALRAQQIQGLYEYVDGYFSTDQGPRLAALARARAALDQALVVVGRREAKYRVPVTRIASWKAGPTAYGFGYLWMVHSLYGWWRDEGKAVDVPLFPCYLNVINPVDVSFGEGLGNDAAKWIGDFLSSDNQRGCLAEPTSEPVYPQDNLRSRP